MLIGGAWRAASDGDEVRDSYRNTTVLSARSWRTMTEERMVLFND